MENFEEIQALWDQQGPVKPPKKAGELIQKAQSHLKTLRRGQIATISILSSAFMFLLVYFIYAIAQGGSKLGLGLGIMMGVLLLRSLVEWISMRRLRAIKPDRSLEVFSSEMAAFYRWRQRIHYWLIPSLFGLYIIGFSMLLPLFKTYLSPGMYQYVLISGFGSLLILVFVILNAVRQETRLIKRLIQFQHDH
jgi:hypothetical protein